MRVKKTLLFIIITSHLIFVIALIFSPLFNFKKQAPPRLFVRTFIPQPKVQHTTTKPPSKTVAVPAAAKKAPPPKRETPPKPASPKPRPPKPNSSTPKKTPAPPPLISDALLKELEQSIAQLQEEPIPTAKLPPQIVIAPLHIDAVGDSSYAEILVHYLQERLRLPDHGEVKIQLHLHQDGTIIKMDVLQAQSEKNRRYLELHLKQLKLPAFKEKKGHPETVVLTFCNESL